jgi:hypothetical protein
MFCFHKYSDLRADGYQACVKCNKLIRPPCAHVWRVEKEIDSFGKDHNITLPPNMKLVHVTYEMVRDILRLPRIYFKVSICEKCGERQVIDIEQ